MNTKYLGTLAKVSFGYWSGSYTKWPYLEPTNLYTLDVSELWCIPNSYPIKHNFKLDQCNKILHIDANQYQHLIWRLIYHQITWQTLIIYSKCWVSLFSILVKTQNKDVATRTFMIPQIISWTRHFLSKGCRNKHFHLLWCVLAWVCL